MIMLDLLKDISTGNTPHKIRTMGAEWEWNNFEHDYESKDEDDYLTDGYNLFIHLDEDVEILSSTGEIQKMIGEPQPYSIEKIGLRLAKHYKKINELVEEVNKLKGECDCE